MVKNPKIVGTPFLSHFFTSKLKNMRVELGISPPCQTQGIVGSPLRVNLRPVSPLGLVTLKQGWQFSPISQWGANLMLFLFLIFCTTAIISVIIIFVNDSDPNISSCRWFRCVWSCVHIQSTQESHVCHQGVHRQFQASTCHLDLATLIPSPSGQLCNPLPEFQKMT